MLVHKLPESICVSGSPTAFTRKPGYRSCPMTFPQVGPIQPTQGSYVGCRSCPVVISVTRMETFYGARRSNAVMLVHKLPESICVSGSPTTFTRKPGYRSCPMTFPQVGPIHLTQGSYVGCESCPVVISGT